MTFTIPEIGLEESRPTVRYIQHLAARDSWTPDTTARHIVGIALESVQDAARESLADALDWTDDHYDHPEIEAADRVIALALDGHAAGLREEVAGMLGPNGKGWRDSGPRDVSDCYHIAYVAARRLALDALTGPDADGIFTQGFVDRYNLAADAREGGL